MCAFDLLISDVKCLCRVYFIAVFLSTAIDLDLVISEIFAKPYIVLLSVVMLYVK